MTTVPTPTTFTYSTHGVDFDAYIPSASGKVPALIFFHGGGLVAGSKSDLWFPTWAVEKALARGIMLISANYRLLIPGTSEDIIQDVHDLFTYLASPTSDFAAFLAKQNIVCDSDRLAVMGASGGDYPARVAATLSTVHPRPKAWFSLYGMAGDFYLDHWVQPHSEDGGFAALTYDPSAVANLLERAEPTSDAPIKYVPTTGQGNDDANRIGLFVHLYRTGTLLDYVLGIPGFSAKIRELPHGQRASMVPQDKRKYLLPLSKDTPPTFLIHGTIDPIVPQEESLKTAQELEELGVKVEHAWLVGAVHGLLDPTNIPNMVAGWEQAADKAFEFVSRAI